MKIKPLCAVLPDFLCKPHLPQSLIAPQRFPYCLLLHPLHLSLCHNPSIWAWWRPGSFLSSLGLFCQRGWFGPLSCQMLPSTSLHPNGAVRRGSAEPAQLVWRLKDSSHVPPKKGSGRTCWQSRASKPFLLLTQQEVCLHMHTRTQWP